MGVYGFAWTPAIIFKVIWTWGPNFWFNSPLAPDSKNCNFLTKPHNTGVYGIIWTLAFIFEVLFLVQAFVHGNFAPN